MAYCLTVTGESLLYGRFDPYLAHLRLTENIYIRGPPGGQISAMHIVAKLSMSLLYYVC